MASLGERIYELRKKKGLTQDQLAEKMGKSGKQVISTWENNRAQPSISELYELAEVLGTTASYLVDGTTVAAEPPAGYTMVPTNELIDLQRRVIAVQSAELQRQK